MAECALESMKSRDFNLAEQPSDASAALARTICQRFGFKTGKDVAVGDYTHFEVQNGRPTGRIYPVDFWVRGDGKTLTEDDIKELVQCIADVFAEEGVTVRDLGESQFKIEYEGECCPIRYQATGYWPGIASCRVPDLYPGKYCLIGAWNGD